MRRTSKTRHSATKSTAAKGPGCVKTPTSNFDVEILSRLRWIGKELLCQSAPKEEKGENSSAHSLLACVFTRPGSKTEIGPRNPGFRSCLNSRHSPTRRSRPKSANKRHHGHSLDHLVGASEQRIGHGQPERPRRPEVDMEQVANGLLHRKIRGLRAVNDLVNKGRALPDQFERIRP